MAVVNGSGRLCKDGKKLTDRDDKINGADEFLFVTQCARTGNGPGATHLGQGDLPEQCNQSRWPTFLKNGPA